MAGGRLLTRGLSGEAAGYSQHEYTLFTLEYKDYDFQRDTNFDF